jgi:hypothetical protein
LPTTDAYGQGVSIPSLTDAPNAFALGDGIVNPVVQRSIMRFASASARTATVTSPVAGMVTYLTDAKRLDYYDGSTWVPVKGQSSSSLVTAGSSSTTSEVTTGMSVTLATRAGVAYELKATALLRSTAGGDRLGLRIRRGTTTAATQVGGGIVDAATPNTGYSCLANGIDTPGAGTTTWTVFVAREGGTGSVDLTASTALPASFVVREI